MRRYFVIAAVLAWTTSGATAAPVLGPWMNADGQGNGPITGADTNSPVVGDGSPNSAEAEMFDSAFPRINLENSGDRVTLSGTVTLEGTVGTAGGPRTQFRFGLFSDDDDGDDVGWTGYYMSNASGTGTPAGTLARKPVGNTSVYLSTTGQNALASTQGDGVNFTDDTYTFSITLERAGDELLVSGTLNGTTNGFTQSLSATDPTASTLGTFSVNYVGFLLGGNLDADRASFSNLDVTFVPVPEPAAAGLLAGGALALTMRRRRRA
jgi:hypothetical protein